jgi:hypothetical protein
MIILLIQNLYLRYSMHTIVYYNSTQFLFNFFFVSKLNIKIIRNQAAAGVYKVKRLLEFKLWITMFILNILE